MKDIENRLKEKIHDYNTLEENIIKHIKNNYFPLIYQCLYERIMPSNSTQFTSEEYKKLLKENNYLKLIDDIYRTRVPKEQDFKKIIESLQEREVNFNNNYGETLKLFTTENELSKNALSFGTKVLHTYNPEENPILDSTIRGALNIKSGMNIDLCVDFKTAMNNFVEKYKDYFDKLKISDSIKNEFNKFKLKPAFPKMKLLDMALLG